MSSIGTVLDELRRQVGSVARLAQRLNVSERAVRQWLKKSEEDLQRLHPDNIASLRQLAQTLGLQFEGPEELKPLWDFRLSYTDNLRMKLPSPPPLAEPLRKVRTQFLSYDLDSPFGVSASVITADSRLVRLLAQTGNAIITYKTVRSRSYGSHPWPNAFFIGRDTVEFDPDADSFPPVVVDSQGEHFQPLNGLINRFGIPSQSPEMWKADFRHAKATLGDGQLLILSVAGTTEDEAEDEILVDDFVKVVGLAVEAGAEVIELNLSCPNSSGQERNVYLNRRLSARICQAARAVATKQRLLAKIGFLRRNDLNAFVIETASYLDGFVAINTVPAEGIRLGLEGNEPAFGGRPGLKAGLSGRPILRLGLRCVEELAEIRARENMSKIGIIGVGGITQPEHVQAYLDLGADAVQASTVFITNPLFGISVRRFLDGQTQHSSTEIDEESRAKANWFRALEELEEQVPARTREITYASVSVWLEWKDRFKEERLNPRQKRVPSVADFKDRIARTAGIYIPRHS